MSENRTEILSTIGVGSGINTTKLIDALVDADTAGTKDTIEKGEESAKAKISALAKIKSDFKTYKDILVQLQTQGSSGYSGDSSDKLSATFTANNNAAGATTNSSLTIQTLAKQHTLTGPSYSSSTATVGSGTLTIDFGTWSADPTSGGGQTLTTNGQSQISVTTTASTTLIQLRDMINAAATDSDTDGTPDVLASVIYTGSAYMLMLKSESGASNEMKVAATSNLASTVGGIGYDYNATTSNLTQRVSGIDSAFTLDGISMTRSSNTVTDAITGFTLKLLKTSSDAISITSEVDLTEVNEIVENYVFTYNEVMENLKILGQHDETDSENDGALNGDSTLRSIQTAMRSLSSMTIAGYENGPYYLSNLGIRTQRDGTLSFRPADLKTQFEYNAETVRAFFSDQLSTSDSNITVNTYDFNNTKPGSYAFATDGSTHTIGGVSASKDGTTYTVSSGDPTGISLEVASGTTSGTVYYGKSFLTLAIEQVEDYLKFDSIIAQRITGFNESLSTLSDKRARMEARIEALYSRYQKSYGQMESTIAGLSQTGDMLTAMLEPKDN